MILQQRYRLAKWNLQIMTKCLVASAQGLVVVSHVAVEKPLDRPEFFINEIAELNVGHIRQRIAMNLPTEVMRIQRRTVVYLFASFLAQFHAAHCRIVDEIFHQLDAWKKEKKKDVPGNGSWLFDVSSSKLDKEHFWRHEVVYLKDLLVHDIENQGHGRGEPFSKQLRTRAIRQISFAADSVDWRSKRTRPSVWSHTSQRVVNKWQSLVVIQRTCNIFNPLEKWQTKIYLIFRTDVCEGWHYICCQGSASTTREITLLLIFQQVQLLLERLLARHEIT